MKVLYATPEAAPFVKTGGLGDVAGSLPSALVKKGIDARVIMPMYKCIPHHLREQLQYVNHIYVDMGWRKQYCGIFQVVHDGVTFYFIDNEFYFAGDKPYDYIHLDCEKFAFFSKAVLSVLPTIGFRPDVINCNDWQTGAIPVFLDTFYDNPFYRGIKTVITIHNLKFQGRWNLEKIKDVMAIGDYYFTSDKLEFFKDVNLLKGGMVYSNKITTVSDTYAEEIKTAEYGENLDGLLRARSNDLVGIVNGISYTDWDPESDPMIYKNYSAQTAAELKKINKTELQKELNLPVDENKFVVGIVSRLTDQKGFDLIASALDSLCDGGCQLVILGTGDAAYENLFRHYAWKYPDKVSSNICFSNELSHKIYAGCDAFLMPSRFEPCGLSQIISMRYGTLPIVRETGGLKDTVIPYNEFTGEGTGFSFGPYYTHDMLSVINYAKETFYNNKAAWNKLMNNAMTQDFSWAKSADKYIDLYYNITGIERPMPEAPAPEVIAEPSPEAEVEAEKPAKKPAAKKTVKKADKAEKAPKAAKAEKPAKATAKTAKAEKAEKPVKAEKATKAAKAEKPAKAKKATKTTKKTDSEK